jgi:hypothetical protein
MTMNPTTRPAQWMGLEPQPAEPAAAERCTREHIQRAIGHLGDLEVVSAAVNASGRYDVPSPSYVRPAAVMPEVSEIEGLPPFCDITVDVRGPGGHVATITVWVPLNWNGRFLGTTGGGNRTELGLEFPEIGRLLNIAAAVRQGFSTAKTDGANKDPRYVEWGLKEAEREIDWDLTENWIHRSTHEMTVIGKAVTMAIHGAAPRYSYLGGCSGGGRQALVEAQRYPEDYDGIWAADPAINWTKFVPAVMWPPLVMKEHGVVLPPSKFNAFRVAAIEACDGLDGLRDGIIGAFDPCDFDARRLIGHVTEAGPITEADAEVIAMIWEGPRTQSGEFLWYGIHPGTNSCGTDAIPLGHCVSAEIEGKREIVPFLIAESYIRAWIKKDPSWDWRTMTFEDYERIFEYSVQELSALASDDPDLTAFGAHGGKMIISHGGNDPLIPAAGSVDYYRRVIETVGSEEKTKRFARLFITEGDGHGFANDPGPGLYTADAITALMKWVELGEAPDEIVAKTIDLSSGLTKAERPAYAYPCVPQYLGSGDPNMASNFAPVHFSQRIRK